jgi:hypothetical protein
MAATRDFGVLEQEILIEQFMAACLRAGFADVRLHPISHVVPLFELRKEDWRAWRTFTRSQRPFRAAEKLWRAALELAGLGKKDILFEEAFAIRLLRELEPVIEQHPVITAHKAPFVRPGRVTEAAAIRLLSAAASARPGEEIGLRVQIRNAGTTSWETAGAAGNVRVGVQLLRVDGSVIDRDYVRHDLPGPLAPGGACEITVPVRAPAPAGAYLLRVDLVREGVSWFQLVGSQVIDHRIEVT